MIKLDGLPELVTDWRAGDLRTEDVYNIVLDMLEHHEVEEILAALPDELCTAVAAALRSSFDNETAAEEVLWIDSGRGEHPAKRQIVERARRWLAQRVTNDPEPEPSRLQELLGRPVDPSEERSIRDLSNMPDAILKEVRGVLERHGRVAATMYVYFLSGIRLGSCKDFVAEVVEQGQSVSEWRAEF